VLLGVAGQLFGFHPVGVISARWSVPWATSTR